MNSFQKIRMGLLITNIKIGNITLDAYAGKKDNNPKNWRTINGSHVHLSEGKIDGGAGGIFHGQPWKGKVPHNFSIPKKELKANVENKKMKTQRKLRKSVQK